jgi:hypothetical protein
MGAYVSAGAAALAFVLSLAPPTALGQRRAPSGVARIAGTITVTIGSVRLKHWGVPGADAAFVPDSDRSVYALRIRSASSASGLCSALQQAHGRDPSIASAMVDGDGNFEHRSGDAELMSFVVIVPHPTAAPHGSLYVCSRPAFAMLSRGAYPNERFYQAAAVHVLVWRSDTLTLHRGERLPVRLAWNVDASSW